MNNLYDINIVVNGSNCKQYNHNGRVYIEAKKGSEYSIQIGNNTCNRILAVCSVDGLNILNGESASEYGPGYIINQYSSTKLDGFRISDSKVAKFVFDYKNSSYATSKNDGSEKNVGVIGVRIFMEKTNPSVKPPYTINQAYWNDNDYYYWNSYKTYRNTSNSDFVNSSFNDDNLDYCNNNVQFDMGTSWGKSKESPSIEVQFERGIMVYSTDIYYASRSKLIEMGVPLKNIKEISFPSSFPNKKFAQPPPGWSA